MKTFEEIKEGQMYFFNKSLYIKVRRSVTIDSNFEYNAIRIKDGCPIMFNRTDACLDPVL